MNRQPERERDSSKKRPKDVGNDSPASEEAKEQSRTGIEGAPRGHGEKGGTDRQPPQSSGRSGRGPKPRERKEFEEDERPGAQGEGAPSPDRVSGSPSQQGQKARSGSRATREQRGHEEATTEGE